MTVTVGDCAKTARPPGMPSVMKGLPPGGRDSRSRVPPCAPGLPVPLRAPGDIRVPPTAVPKSFCARALLSPGVSDALSALRRALAPKVTVTLRNSKARRATKRKRVQRERARTPLLSGLMPEAAAAFPSSLVEGSVLSEQVLAKWVSVTRVVDRMASAQDELRDRLDFHRGPSFSDISETLRSEMRASLGGLRTELLAVTKDTVLAALVGHEQYMESNLQLQFSILDAIVGRISDIEATTGGKASFAPAASDSADSSAGRSCADTVCMSTAQHNLLLSEGISLSHQPTLPPLPGWVPVHPFEAREEGVTQVVNSAGSSLFRPLPPGVRCSPCPYCSHSGTVHSPVLQCTAAGCVGGAPRTPTGPAPRSTSPSMPSSAHSLTTPSAPPLAPLQMTSAAASRAPSSASPPTSPAAARPGQASPGDSPVPGSAAPMDVPSVVSAGLAPSAALPPKSSWQPPLYGGTDLWRRPKTTHGPTSSLSASPSAVGSAVVPAVSDADSAAAPPCLEISSRLDAALHDGVSEALTPALMPTSASLLREASSCLDADLHGAASAALAPALMSTSALPFLEASSRLDAAFLEGASEALAPTPVSTSAPPFLEVSSDLDAAFHEGAPEALASAPVPTSAPLLREASSCLDADLQGAVPAALAPALMSTAALRFLEASSCLDAAFHEGASEALTSAPVPTSAPPLREASFRLDADLQGAVPAALAPALMSTAALPFLEASSRLDAAFHCTP